MNTVDNYFNSSYKNMVSHFAKKRKISAELRNSAMIENKINLMVFNQNTLNQKNRYGVNSYLTCLNPVVYLHCFFL
jgi:hypothetical protein